MAYSMFVAILSALLAFADAQDRGRIFTKELGSITDVEISLPFLVKVVSTGDDQASFELEVKTWPAWEMEEFLAFQGQEAGRLSIDMQPGRDLADEESRGILRVPKNSLMALSTSRYAYLKVDGDAVSDGSFQIISSDHSDITVNDDPLFKILKATTSGSASLSVIAYEIISLTFEGLGDSCGRFSGEVGHTAVNLRDNADLYIQGADDTVISGDVVDTAQVRYTKGTCNVRTGELNKQNGCFQAPF